MISVKKTSYFEVAPPVHTLVYKNVDLTYLKQRLVYILICNQRIGCLRNVQIFIDVSYEVLLL